MLSKANKSFKAIIFDLDGTAIPNTIEGTPSKRLVSAIAQVKDNLILCAATGRPPTYTKELFTKLCLTYPCVVSAGTKIISPVTNECLWQYPFEQDDVSKILKICSKYPYQIFINEPNIKESGILPPYPTINYPVNVVYIMKCTKKDAKSILTELNKIRSIASSEVRSWTKNHIDIHITHKKATKEYGIRKLLEILGLEKSEVAGVGDSDNDIHLFNAVGYKVAMGNGTDRLKALADITIDSVENDGLAKFIEAQLQN
ncbi:HAD family phosphatase [bacterium]|nr:HAD family phosphatase [bacterium]